MPLEGIMLKERAIAQSNLVAIARTRLYVRAFYSAELKIRIRETELMSRDEELYKKN